MLVPIESVRANGYPVPSAVPFLPPRPYPSPRRDCPLIDESIGVCKSRHVPIFPAIGVIKGNASLSDRGDNQLR